ncbi:MAG: BatD family protein [Chitinispirillales bacterium]|jgi:hypothetical protein|nr:BatD family protein [Chitinispirillales bacterium]
MKYKTVFYKIYCVPILLLTLFFTSHGQVISASALPDSVTVGDEISLRVTLQTPKRAKVIAPETEKGFGDFIVRDYKTETKSGSGYDTTVYNYTVAIYKPQNCTIPSLSFLVNLNNDLGSDTLYSQSIPINVISVLPQDGEDGEFLMKDLKGQQVTGHHSVGWIFWLLLIAVIGASAFYLFRRFTRNKNNQAASVPQKPAYEEAIEALTLLEEKKLVLAGLIKEHVFELSEIFKRYISRRFGTNALEFTTDEMILWLESSRLAKELCFNAEWFFRASDPVKFARLIPDSQTLEKFDNEVRKFIEATKPMPDIQNEAEMQGKTEKMECVS